jgi:DNA invertase Pin-like site-specific DNA recombinase
MARIGYARVSTRDQHPEGQRERLEAAGCTRIFTDHGASGTKASRPEWDRCLDRLGEGDVLVCTKLDRIGRSVRNLTDVVTDLGKRGVDIVILDQGIDTTTPAGKFMFHIMASVAQFERDLIIERTRDGLAATTARGRNGGRKHRLSDAQVARARKLRANGHSVKEIGQLLGNGKPVSRQTVYRTLGMMQLSEHDERARGRCTPGLAASGGFAHLPASASADGPAGAADNSARAALWRAGRHTSVELAELFSVARSTVYRAVARAGEPAPAPAARA